ncbi:zinc finger, CCHC-type containing protein [Tanacetum coccineum]
MGDANPICALRDYPKPSHEGYMNTIEQPVGNNVVPLRSDTIRLMQNGCSFYRPWSEDPNQHLKDFLKLVDSLDLDGENRERTRSITTWEDLPTHFLAQFFPPGRTAKLRNDILMFQQHQGESLSETWTCFKDLLQKVPHHGIDLSVQGNLFASRCLEYIRSPPHRARESSPTLDGSSSCSDTTYSSEQNHYLMQFTMNQGPRKFNEAANTWKGKLNFNWAHTQTFTSPRNGSFSTYSSSYQMKLEKALVDFDSHQEKRLSSLRTQLGQQQDDRISKINLLWKAISKKLDDAPIRDTVGNSTAQMNFTSTNDPMREELRGKGIKSPSKLLS